MLARLAVPTLDEAPSASGPLLERVRGHFGFVPGVFRLAASSPAVLTGFMALSDALGAVLDVKTRLRIALAVSQVNGCDCCLSANRFMALNQARISPEEIELARKGGASEPKAAAAVHFAAKVAAERGRIGDADLAAVRAAGFGDPEIVEMVALVAQATFTNFLNEVAQTDIDFPRVRSAEAG